MRFTDILTDRFTNILIERHSFLFLDFRIYMTLSHTEYTFEDLPHIEYPFEELNIGNIINDFLIDLGQALILASTFGGTRDVKLFLELGADVNATNEYGDNSLEGALVDEKLEIVKLLVDAGSKLSEDYYEAAEYYGEEYTKPLRIAYERTLNSN